jgi:hypothetical protein
MTEGAGEPRTRPRSDIRASRVRLGLRPPDRERARHQSAAKVDLEKKERDRSYRLALASLGLSVVVAVVTPIASVLVAKQNAESAEVQAERAFVREEKKTAYTDFFTAAEQLQSAEISAAAPMATPQTTPPGQSPDSSSQDSVSNAFSARMKDIQTKADDLDKKFALVLVASSAPTATAATKLNDFVAGQNLQDAIHVTYAAVAKSPGWQQQVRDLVGRIESGHADFDDFLNAVRADMGSEPLDLK